MKAVIQRVTNASVSINNQVTSSIKYGLLILLGIENADESEDAIWLSSKISQLRIFDDKDGVMNLSILDIKGEALVVSQFTLHAKTKKGNRPSYIHAAKPDNLAVEINELLDNYSHNEEALLAFISAVIKISVPVNFYTVLLGRSGVYAPDHNVEYTDEIDRLAGYLADSLHNRTTNNISQVNT